MSFISLQDQIPRKLFFTKRQPWVCVHQQNLWVLRWVWVLTDLISWCSMYFKNTKKPVYSYSTNPDRRFSSSTSQHFKMFPPFASSEGYSASGVRYQSDGVRDTHPLPHSESTRIRERMCDLTLTLSHSPFAFYSYISSYSLLIIPSTVL